MRKNQGIINELKTDLDRKKRELMEEKGKTLMQFIVSKYIKKE